MTTPSVILNNGGRRRRKKERRLIPKIVAYISCSAGRMHFAPTNMNRGQHNSDTLGHYFYQMSLKIQLASEGAKLQISTTTSCMQC
jgi:hypothetical protein